MGVVYHAGCYHRSEMGSLYHGGGLTDVLYHGGGITHLLYRGGGMTDVLYHGVV